MVLWKKESTSADAYYVDLLSEAEKEFFSGKFTNPIQYNDETNKDDDISTELRTQGNQLFKEKKWPQALELYNRSLRYATDGSENHSLAYANRSLCFFQMQKYDQCLVDIELARKANYPERLMQKLKDREAACLKMISDKSWKPEVRAKPVLSYDADEKLPDLANVLEIRNNVEFGDHIVAKCDIGVGKIVMLGDMFVASAHNKDQTYCKTCLKSTMNLIPCQNCSDVMFCDDQCMASNTIHTMSCHALRDQIFIIVQLVESILIAVTAFESVDKLMEFVGSALATSDFNVPECDSAMQTKYRSFLKLDVANKDDEELKRRIFLSHHLMMQIPEIQQRFQSTQEKRFLAHLILQHEFIFNKHFALFHIVHYIDHDGTNTKHPDISGLWPFHSLIATSCIRNVTVKHVKNQMFAYVVRPIKEGEPLFTEDLMKKADADCKCSKCVPMYKEVDRHRLQLEPDNQFLQRTHKNDYNHAEKRLVLKTKLGNLLQKYGRLPWTPEVEWISKFFDWAMRKEYCD